MTSSWFDLGLTSKILNLSFLWFNERSESENLANQSRYYYLDVDILENTTCKHLKLLDTMNYT